MVSLASSVIPLKAKVRRGGFVPESRVDRKETAMPDLVVQDYKPSYSRRLKQKNKKKKSKAFLSCKMSSRPAWITL